MFVTLFSAWPLGAHGDGGSQPFRLRVFADDLLKDDRLCLHEGQQVPDLSPQDSTAPPVRQVTTGQPFASLEPRVINCTAQDVMRIEHIELIKTFVNRIGSETGAFIASLKAPRKALLQVGKTTCTNVKEVYPIHEKLGVINADTIIYLTFSPSRSPGERQAVSEVCDVDETGRATVGHINIEPSAIARQSSLGLLGLLRLEGAVSRELLSILGVNSGLLTNRTITRSVRGKNVTLFTGPETVKAARKYFGCPTLEGMEIEDHYDPALTGSLLWEKRVLYTDVLTAWDGFQLSAITLAALADTGYYAIADNEDVRVITNYIQFGRHAGCSFLQDKCDTTAGGMDTFFCFSNTGAHCRWNSMFVSSPTASCTFSTYASHQIPEPFRYAWSDQTQNDVLATSYRGGHDPILDFCPVPDITNMIEKGCYYHADRMTSPYGVRGVSSACFPTRSLNATGFLDQMAATAGKCLPTKCTSVGLEFEVFGEWVKCPVKGDLVADVANVTRFAGFVQCPKPEHVYTICAGRIATMPVPSPSENDQNATPPPPQPERVDNGTDPGQPLPSGVVPVTKILRGELVVFAQGCDAVFKRSGTSRYVEALRAAATKDLTGILHVPVEVFYVGAGVILDTIRFEFDAAAERSDGLQLAMDSLNGVPSVTTVLQRLNVTSPVTIYKVDSVPRYVKKVHIELVDMHLSSGLWSTLDCQLADTAIRKDIAEVLNKMEGITNHSLVVLPNDLVLQQLRDQGGSIQDPATGRHMYRHVEGVLEICSANPNVPHELYAALKANQPVKLPRLTANLQSKHPRADSHLVVGENRRVEEPYLHYTKCNSSGCIVVMASALLTIIFAIVFACALCKLKRRRRRMLAADLQDEVVFQATRADEHNPKEDIKCHV